ncbi:hypothetical protein BT67DRAFT_92911 [Trichocladium antarcticum]|uniref:Secreted protein n=1 Tax=Trichocladium antarcticum TaxID=1450529 RepID=A0AAN6UG99_9PEZI|nr:hypothetical protein BT67DRAFT_92911 [Trichocladium antarcticum]
MFSLWFRAGFNLKILMVLHSAHGPLCKQSQRSAFEMGRTRALKRTGKDFQTTGGAQARQPRQQQTGFREQTRRRGAIDPTRHARQPANGQQMARHPPCIVSDKASRDTVTSWRPCTYQSSRIAMNGNAMFLTGTTPHLPDPSQPPPITPRTQ